jgi:hypothetical protein
MYRVRPANGGSADFAHSDASDLVLLGKLSKRRGGDLDRSARIDACHFKHVYGLDPIQDPQCFMDRCTNALAIALRPCCRTVCALNAEDDFVGIFRILPKVVLEEVKRVVLRGAIVYALRL